MSTDNDTSNAFRWWTKRGSASEVRARSQGGADPVMIRAYHNGNKGATAFFRNHPFLDTLLDVVAQLKGDQCKILFHAASVGAECYSFILRYLHSEHRRKVNLDVFATDIDDEFLQVAKQGVYPAEVTEGMTSEEIGWFEIVKGGVRVPDEVQQRVRFLPLQ